MKALLLAAGVGMRLRPITDNVPKCMVQILGRPLLDYWLELLGPRSQCHQIFINTHYLPEAVRHHVHQSPYRGKIVLLHEETLLGTAGTLIQHMRRFVGDDLLVAHADNLTLFQWDDFERAFRKRPPPCVATMMSFETDSPRSCGILEVDEHEILQGFHEKVVDPPGTLANAAVFLFSPEALDVIQKISPESVLDISREIIPRLLGRMNVWKNEVYHRDIGTPDSLRLAQLEFPKSLHKLNRGA